MKSAKEVFDIIVRDADSVVSADSLWERMNCGRPLVIKFGADPSRPDLHLGHSVPLRKLRLLQELGHKIVFLIGDFTGMIGDPSGRSKTRVPLTFEQTRANARTYFEQVGKILDVDKAEIRYNSEWLGKMNFSDVLSLAGKYTVARVLERDDFAKRFASGAPIGMHELFYPLMQGYDSVALGCDVEFGGRDQTFNLLVGRELQRDYGQTPQEVVTFPLLPGLDGVEKMSKSLDNYIGVDEPADIMFEKCMRVPDAVLPDYFRLTTDLDPSSVPPEARAAHFCYAREIVRLYHGADAVSGAEERYNSVALGGTPENIPETPLDPGMTLAAFLVKSGLAPSGSEARRLISGGAVRINGSPANDPRAELAPGDVVKKGKSSFARAICAR